MENKFQSLEDFIRERLTQDERLATGFLKETLKDYAENRDKKELLLSLKLLAEARGLSKLSKQTGISRNAFYKSLTPEGNPKLNTFLAILNGLNLKMEIKSISD